MSVEAPRSSTRSSPNVPPIDLRHMTSATVLAPLAPGDNRRASQHLQPNARKGSRSPSSIPSSPTSVLVFLLSAFCFSVDSVFCGCASKTARRSDLRSIIAPALVSSVLRGSEIFVARTLFLGFCRPFRNAPTTHLTRPFTSFAFFAMTLRLAGSGRLGLTSRADHVARSVLAGHSDSIAFPFLGRLSRQLNTWSRGGRTFSQKSALSL
ncbi:hypothetical protein B0H14DRAFT_2708774, partial [Mycena olivaceomarginata]